MPHNLPLFKEHHATDATSREIERDSNFLTRRSSRRGTWGAMHIFARLDFSGLSRCTFLTGVSIHAEFYQLVQMQKRLRDKNSEDTSKSHAADQQ